MPLTHVIIKDKRYSVAEAKTLLASRSDRLPYTPELFAAMLATRQERDYISTTSITAKCSRQQSIMRQVDYTEDVDKMWASFRGTMFHGQLEKNVVAPAIEEPRFFTYRYMEEFGVELSGSPDLIDPVAGLLYDYKFTKENPRFDYPWKDHVWQGQINRWLCDHADKVSWRGHLFTPEEPDNTGVFVSETHEPVTFRPIDWQGIYVIYMDDKGAKPLLCTKSIDIPKVGGVGTKKARVADVWSDEEVETFMDDRFPEVYSALAELEIPPAPEGWEHQGHVLCGYCPVRNECAGFEREGI